MLKNLIFLRSKFDLKKQLVGKIKKFNFTNERKCPKLIFLLNRNSIAEEEERKLLLQYLPHLGPFLSPHILRKLSLL